MNIDHLKLLSLDELSEIHDVVVAKLGDAMLAEKARLEERAAQDRNGSRSHPVGA